LLVSMVSVECTWISIRREGVGTAMEVVVPTI
jgi:hypothetical protein